MVRWCPLSEVDTAAIGVQGEMGCLLAYDDLLMITTCIRLRPGEVVHFRACQMPGPAIILSSLRLARDVAKR